MTGFLAVFVASISNRIWSYWPWLVAGGMIAALGSRAAIAQPFLSQSSPDAIAELTVIADTLWVLFAGCLVFFMNAGFAMLETGFCRQKNAVNLLAKNLIVFALSTVAFWSVGFGVMFSDGNGLFGTSSLFLAGADNSPLIGDRYRGVFTALSEAGIPLQAKFFFQLVFAGTAATIVSGAVAERIKFSAFFAFSLIIVGIIYPISGHWIWGGGWLARLGFFDFAGSTAVHSVGGWCALVGAVFLGPRIGKYDKGASLALPGHNLTVATLGCFILWLGWFGFNAGSTFNADPHAISHVLLTTNLAAAMGAISATIVSWRYFGKPDLSVMINGVLGGLVAITAACRYVNLGGAALIGVIAGTVIVFAVDFFDRQQIDDPAGTISAHLVCGVWGTLAVALFAVGSDWLDRNALPLYTTGPAPGLFMGGGMAGVRQLFVQLLGIALVSLFTLLASALAWKGIDLAIGLRVSPQAELKGLDVSEHGLHAYNGFVLEVDPTEEKSFNRDRPLK